MRPAMGALLGLLLTIPLAAQVELEERTLARDWAALDLYHLSRSLPALGTIVDTPINPGVQVSYHHAWFGRRVTGGTTLQAGVVGFDELFWSLSTGAGFEGVWRTDSGFYSALGLRVDYARLFTGSNNFEFEDGRYRQATDSGRSFLRITLADLYLGFSPALLRRVGVVPALRYAWLVDLPLYANEDANPWSYTQFGPSLLWFW
jgi:hypothetical protein